LNIRGKNVFVTGSEGFIGSHLVERLLEEGCKVRALVHYNSFNSWGWLDSLPPTTLKEIEITSGDVRDPNGMRSAVKDSEIVFHLAALIAIPYSYSSPDSYVDTNIKGTLNLLQAAREADCERILVTSTSEVYGTAKYVPIDESHPFQGQSPYSASKIGADRLAESFHRSFGMPIVIVRPFNTFGPRQSARAVIPSVIIQLLSGKSLVRMGSLHPTRDFTYVKDTCRGFVAIAETDACLGEEINIATETEISVGALAQKIIRQINPGATIAADPARIRPDKSEVERLVGSNRKLRSLTNWSPEYGIDRALEQTITWFRDPENLARYKAEIYNV
jgi:NAD dependent epimerase/dehydratase